MTITVCPNSMKVLFAALTLLTFYYTHAASSSSYGAYGNYTLGSSRVMGLGGAYTAVSSDSNAFLYNPAGTALSERDFQFDASTNLLNNNELVTNRGYVESLSSRYDLVGAHFKTGRLSFGLGYNIPYTAKLTQFSTVEPQVSHLLIQEMGLNVSYELSKEWAVGFNGKYAQARHVEEKGAVKNEMSINVNYFQWGILYQKNRFAIGYSFSPSLYFEKPSDAVATFLDISAPQKQVLGISYFIKPKKVRLNIDFVSVGDINKNAVAFEDSLGFYKETLKSAPVTFPKLGLEFVLVESARTNAQFRVGYYDEPSRFVSTSSRKHFTLGFEVRLGPALLQVSQDQATGFNNVSQALSVVMDKL